MMIHVKYQNRQFHKEYIFQESKLKGEDTEESKKRKYSRKDSFWEIFDSDDNGEDSGGYDEDDEGDASDAEILDTDDVFSNDQGKRASITSYEEICYDVNINEGNRRESIWWKPMRLRSIKENNDN